MYIPSDGVHGGEGLVLDDGSVRSGKPGVMSESRVQDGSVRMLTELHELHVVEMCGRVVVAVGQQG